MIRPSRIVFALAASTSFAYQPSPLTPTTRSAETSRPLASPVTLISRQSLIVANVFPPDNHHREACRIIGNLKGNAALLAAFSFSALTAKELPGGSGADPMLQQAYVVLACLTLAFELVAVFVGQQLLYRMADGSFGVVASDGKLDPERTILGILLSNYRDDFSTVRFTFLAGIGTMMGTIAIRAWATYEAPLAAAVTLIFVGAAGVMASSNRGTLFEFERVRLLDGRAASVRESFDEVPRCCNHLRSQPAALCTRGRARWSGLRLLPRQPALVARRLETLPETHGDRHTTAGRAFTRPFCSRAGGPRRQRPYLRRRGARRAEPLRPRRRGRRGAHAAVQCRQRDLLVARPRGLRAAGRPAARRMLRERYLVGTVCVCACGVCSAPRERTYLLTTTR